MKQRTIVLNNITPENAQSKLPEYITKYNKPTRDGQDFQYMDNAIPFLINYFNDTNGNKLNIFFNMSTHLENKKRLSRKYILNNFWVYNISDYGNQSLSPGFDDFIPLCFDSDGYKITQYYIAMIKNYTTKETFILIPKLVDNVNITIKVIINSKNPKSIESANYYKITRNENETFFNFSLDNPLDNNNTTTLRTSDINDISFFIYDTIDEKYYELKNSNYFYTFDEEYYTTDNESTFVAEQKEYFKKSSSNELPTKIYHTINLKLNDNLKNINDLYLRSRKNYSDYIFKPISYFSNRDFDRTDYLSIFIEGPTSDKMTRLIAGEDYYIDINNKLQFTQSDKTKKVEVFLKSYNDKRLQIIFEATADDQSFYIKRALYDNYIGHWNINVPATINTLNQSSTLLIYKNGKLFSFVDTITDYDTGLYQYTLEDIDYSENEVAAPSGTNTVTIIDEGLNNTFNHINKYTITTDPYLETFGETLASNFNEQEVYLYDSSLNFKLDSLEPFITKTGNLLNIQNIDDPYPDLLENTIIPKYEDFQIDDDSGKTALLTKIHTNSNAQSIETNIVQLKKNLFSILDNSSITYLNYTPNSTINLGQFMFLILTGSSNNSFDIDYINNDTVIKKEYNCTFDTTGCYISMPFFFNTFENNLSTISFKISRGTITGYYAFK